MPAARAARCGAFGGSIVSLTYFMEHGTDIKEALRFARQLLGSNRTANRQIILITDGEPTAATLDRGGRLHSGWGSAMLHGRKRSSG